MKSFRGENFEITIKIELFSTNLFNLHHFTLQKKMLLINFWLINFNQNWSYDKYKAFKQASKKSIK
jgi:hypothetical protein